MNKKITMFFFFFFDKHGAISKLFNGKLTMVGFFSTKKLFLENLFKTMIKYFGNFLITNFFFESE